MGTEPKEQGRRKGAQYTQAKRRTEAGGGEKKPPHVAATAAGEGGEEGMPCHGQGLHPPSRNSLQPTADARIARRIDQRGTQDQNKEGRTRVAGDGESPTDPAEDNPGVVEEEEGGQRKLAPE